MDTNQSLPEMYTQIIIILFMVSVPSLAYTQVYFGGNGQILVTDNEGKNPSTFLNEDIRGLVIDSARSVLFYSNVSSNSNQMVDKIMLDGSGAETILRDHDLDVNGIAPRGIALDESAMRVYIADNLNDGRILAVNYDGTGAEVIIDGEPDGVVTGILDVAVDTLNSKLYWGKLDAIMRSNLDGTDIEMVAEVDRIVGQEDNPVQPLLVELDPQAGLVYWGDRSKNQITVAGFDGANKKKLIDTSRISAGLQLDPLNGKIYWLEDVRTRGTATLMQADLDGSNSLEIASYSTPTFNTGPIFILNLQTATSISREPGVSPERIALHQNYPNPFNPSTTIEYDLSASSKVRLELFDIAGRRVALLVDERQPAGAQRLQLDVGYLSSGIYIYRLSAGDLSQTRKLTLIK